MWQKRLVCVLCGVLALGFPAGGFAQSGQQASVRDSQPVAPNHDQRSPSTVNEDPGDHPAQTGALPEGASEKLPDSPGVVQSQIQNAPQQPSSSPEAASPSPQSQTPQSMPDQGAKLQRPVGTAAAEAPAVSGITAAQPAGVAIAPAKQRRVRVIVLKVGAIVGAGVAVGTVVALTAGTGGKPPGAR